MAKKDDEKVDAEGSETPNPWEIMARIASAMEVLAARTQQPGGDSQAEGLIKMLAPALERLGDAQIASGKLIADETRRAHRPSNEIPRNVSVFNRRGDLIPPPEDDLGAPGTQFEGLPLPRKPKLKCTMLVPFLVEWESATREEVELLNLLQAGEYIVKRIDNSKVRTNIQIEYRVDGKTPSRLVMNHETAYNNDNFRMMPSLADILRQVLKQHDDITIRQQAAAILTDEEEEALIEAGEIPISA